jgi:hypothetical protein
MADPTSDGGCLRRWWYEKIDGRRPEERVHQTVGIAIHNEIERYLRGDSQALGPVSIRGKPYMPEPGPDLFVEHDLVIPPAVELRAREAATEAEANAIRAVTLDKAPLCVGETPVVGYIDLLHNRCTNRGTSDIEDTIDPEGTVEVLDWKTTSRPEYVKSADAMARTLQMTIYAKWVLTTLPATTWVRLSHVYFLTRGSALPTKVSLRVPRERIEQQWAHVSRVAGSVIEAARETHADAVPGNTRACDAYGGCPHRSYCSAAAHGALVELFGLDGAQRMIRSINNVTTTTAAPRKSLLGLGKKAPAPDPQAVFDVTQRVIREEIEARYPGIPAAWDELIACGVGFPECIGDLARVVSELQGLPPATHVDGEGELAAYGPFSDPGELPDLLNEVKLFMTAKAAGAPAPAPEPIPVLPPDAPASDPELASVRPAAAALVAAPKKRPGRPRKELGPDPMTQLPLPAVVDIAAPVVAVVDVPPPQEAQPPKPELAHQRIYFYVNCRPSCPFESFWPVVNDMVQEMNRVAGDALDFRLVPNDHQFAYGRWKAAMAAALRVAPLSRGHYVLDGAHGEIGITVAEAMRGIIAERDGVFVQ